MTRRQADQEPCATMRLAGGHLPAPPVRAVITHWSGPTAAPAYSGQDCPRRQAGQPLTDLIGEEPPTPAKNAKTPPPARPGGPAPSATTGPLAQHRPRDNSS